MNKPDLIEKQNRLAELKENNVSLKSQISGFEVKNAIEDLPKVQEVRPYHEGHNSKSAVRQKGRKIMKYDARACQFNMGTGCVELLLRDGRKISINCTGVEDALDVTMAQRSELDYLIYNDPLAYAELILNGEPEEYLRNAAGSHGLED